MTHPSSVPPTPPKMTDEQVTLDAYDSRLLRDRIRQMHPDAEAVIEAAQDFEMAARNDALGMGAGTQRMLDNRHAAELRMNTLIQRATTEVKADIALLAGTALAIMRRHPK